MNAWGDLIQRLTQRLEVDEELRLDVARELHGHLEDSASEFRAAGQSDAEAAASAAKALGDEKDLAEQLWEANRGRIRLRGLLRWTARVTLLPAAAVVTLVLFTYLVGLAGFYDKFWGPGRRGSRDPLWPMGPLGKLVCDPYVGASLTADQRFLLEGAPDARSKVDKAKSISDRWPDNPVYYANYYIVHLLYQPGFRKERTGELTERFDEVMLLQTLAALRKGERIDPDNAFYNAEAASLLIQASSTLREDPSATYDKLTRKGQTEPTPVHTIEITDPQRFQQGLEEFHRALAKPVWTTRSMEMLHLRLDALGAPTRLIQYLNRLARWVGVSLPDLASARELGKSLAAYARVLAEQGKVGQAVQLLGDVRRLAAKMGAHPDFLVGLLLAESITTHTLGCEEVLYRDLHQSDQAARARQERMGEYELFNRIMSGRRQIAGAADEANMGFLESLVTPSLPGYDVDMRAARQAELFAVTEVGLLVLLVVLLVPAVVLGLAAVVERVVVPRADRGVLLFVGWRRVGRILLLAVAVPLGAYAVYLAISSACQGGTGLTRSSVSRVIVELAAILAIILALVVRLSCKAIRQRAAELGLTVRPARRWRDRLVMWGLTGAVALAVLGYLVGWWAGPFRQVWPPVEGDNPAGVLAAMIGGVLLLWGAREWIPGLEAPPWVSWRKRPVMLALTGLVVLLVLAYLIGWLAGPLRQGRWFGWEAHALPACVAVIVAALLVLWGLREWIGDLRRSAPAARYHRSVARSLVPVLAASVIVLGVALGGVLAVGEGWAIKQTGTGLPMPDEIANSDFRLLQERFIEMDKSFRQGPDRPRAASAPSPH